MPSPRRRLALLALSVFTVSCGPVPSLRVATRPKAARPSVPPGAALNSPKEVGGAPALAAGLIANNAGALSGSVWGPRAGILSNNAAGLISNNGGGIVSNNGGGIISNNSGRFRLLQTDGRLVAIGAARVEVLDTQGRSLSDAVTTGADGRFAVGRLKPSGPLVVVRASYTADGRSLTMSAVVPAPRRPGNALSDVSPGSTYLAAKAQTKLKADPALESTLAAASLGEAAGRLGEVLSDRAIALAVLLPVADVAAACDQILTERPDVARALETLAGPTLSTVEVTPSPSASPLTLPKPSGGSGGSAPAATPTPTPTPWPTAAAMVMRVAGSASGGMTVGANRLGDTFTEIGGLVVTPADAYLVADTANNQLRRLPTAGASQLIAGMADGSAGYNATTNATNTPLDQPHGVAYDAVAGDVYFCDTGNQRIRYLAGGVLTTLVGGGADASDAVAVAANAQLASPMGLARDAAGNLFFTEGATSRVRRYDAGTGGVTTLATGPGNGPIALDEADGLVWVANGGVVKAITNINGVPSVAATPTFQAMAGTGSPQVTGLAYDGAGTLYVAQASFPGSGIPVDARIFRVAVDAAGLATATPVTIAGTGGQSVTPSDYSVPTIATDGLTLPLASKNWCALTFGPDGAVYAGNSYPGQWGQVLKLTP